MSSRAFLMMLLAVTALAAPRAVAAASRIDWADFTARSDSRDDPLLLSALEGGDFDTRAAICSAIGRRSDPSAADILSWLLDGYSSARVYQAEHLLRLALVSLFPGAVGDAQSAARISANSRPLAEMVESIDSFKDPQLRGTIVRLLPLLRDEGGRRALMKTGTDIIGTLTKTDGTLSPQGTSLAFDYLYVVKVLGNMDFFEQCLAISRLSRDRSIVTAARGAASALSGVR